MDESGAPDTVEFINVSKDDALAWPDKVHREYPSTVNARMENTIRPFMLKSLEVNNTFLDIFNDKLGLPKGTLAERHKMYEPSGSESRCIKNPPRSGASADGNSKTAIGAHTDFGSLVRTQAGCSLTSVTELSAVCSRSSTIVWVASKSCLLALIFGTTFG